MADTHYCSNHSELKIEIQFTSTMEWIVSSQKLYRLPQKTRLASKAHNLPLVRFCHTPAKIPSSVTCFYNDAFLLFSVPVPAKVEKKYSSADVLALEGTNVSLICNVSGKPTPRVTWTVHRFNTTGSEGMYSLFVASLQHCSNQISPCC